MMPICVVIATYVQFHRRVIVQSSAYGHGKRSTFIRRPLRAAQIISMLNLCEYPGFTG